MTLSPAGTLLADLTAPESTALVEARANRACIQVTLPPHGIALYTKPKAE
jgi:hypothetical protein